MSGLNSTFISWRTGRAQARARRGFVVSVYSWLLLWMALFPAAALTYDMSRLYWEQGQAQRAADASALAGAWCLAYPGNCTVGYAAYAANFAKYNGYDNTVNGITATATNPYSGNPAYVHVVVRRAEPLVFSRIFFWTTAYVSASATASYTSFVHAPITTADYGIASNADYNYSQFGPYALYSDGDFNSTKYLDSTQGANAGLANPLYNPNGINFIVSVPTSMTAYTKLADNTGGSKFQVQIYDPTTTSGSAIDEIRAPYETDSGYGTHGASNAEDTVTQYTLVQDLDGNPDNKLASDHVTISTQSYGDNTAYANQWVTPSGFTVDLSASAYSPSTYPNESFHVNVLTTDGSSENGFTIRAGPQYTKSTLTASKSVSQATADANWQAAFAGTSNTSTEMQVSADNILPVNLNEGSSVDITLGAITPPSTLPSGATNGGTITVTKFDTDVGATANGIKYVMENSSGTAISGETYTPTSPGLTGSKVGINTGNGVFSYDTIILPTNFTGGVLHAIYSAGASDTSEWSMSYSGNTQQTETLKLVG